MHALYLLAIETEPIVGVGLTSALVAGLIGLLRLYGTGTARIDSAAESRVTALMSELERSGKRCDSEIKRGQDRERMWEARCAELTARVKELEGRP